MFLRLMTAFLFSYSASAATVKEYDQGLLSFKKEKTHSDKLKRYQELKTKLLTQVEKLEDKEKFSTDEKFEIELDGLLDLYPVSAFEAMNCDAIENKVRSDYTGTSGTHMTRAAEYFIKLSGEICKK